MEWVDENQHKQGCRQGVHKPHECGLNPGKALGNPFVPMFPSLMFPMFPSTFFGSKAMLGDPKRPRATVLEAHNLQTEYADSACIDQLPDERALNPDDR